MILKRTLVRLTFFTAIGASIATSYGPAWHLSVASEPVPLTLTEEKPKATFIVTISGNRAAFPESHDYFGTVRLAGELESVAGATVTLGQSPPGRLAPGERRAFELEVPWQTDAPCASETCVITTKADFALNQGGPVTGTFRAHLELDGPTVPKNEAPDNPRVTVAVAPAP